MQLNPTIKSTAITILIVISTSITKADELSRTDKLRVLYSNQFSFDRRGVPLITIGIAEGLSEVVIESELVLRVLPDGEDGSEVLAGKSWRVKLKKAKPALVEHYVVLGQYPVNALAQMRKEMAAYKARGVRCRMIETGTIFGTKGQVYDNRDYVLVEGPYPTNDKAMQKAETYVQKYGLSKVATISQLEKRPTAQLIAVDQKNATQINVHDAIWFAPSKEERLFVRTNNQKSQSYWGQIYVTVDQNGKLAVVNAVPADKLLAGLVPAEIFASAPTEALRAQAVAARGDLLAKIGTRHLADPYLICATQHCQVYRGAGFEHPRTTNAVTTTKGLVLVRADGRIVKALYSAACGGHTEHNDQVWPTEPDPNLRGHLDAYQKTGPFAHGINEQNIEAWLNSHPQTWCGQSGVNQPKYRWTKKISASQMAQLVEPLGIGQVKEIQVLARGHSGRARLIEILGSQATKQVRGELKIRQLFGGLNSSMFTVLPIVGEAGFPSTFVFKGGGWGHGVGMCQSGAIGMAKSGQNFQQILKHYYLASELKPLY
ncbi:MAG: SpoIID/LytB domain-containing protein [Pseudomonadota bacterium]